MKKNRWLALAIIMALLTLTPISTPMINTTAVANAATVAISNKTFTLEVGKTKLLKMLGTAKKPTWSSSKKTVATISSTGYVTAKAAGKATITAVVNGKKYTSLITVVLPVKLNRTSITLDINKTGNLNVTGTTKTVLWSTSNSTIAVVSSKGVITAKKAGTASIYASVAGKKLSCTVKVIDPSKLNYTTYSLEAGKKVTLKITGTTSKVSWSSSDSAIAKVSGTGVVTAVAPGNATINASVNGRTFSCQLTVLENHYLTNAPFEAQEVKNDIYRLVIPKAWNVNSEYSNSNQSLLSLSPSDASSTSSMNLLMLNVGMGIPDYDTVKATFSDTLSESFVLSIYDNIYAGTDTDYSLTDYKQSDLSTDHGKVFKIDYTLTVNGAAEKHTTYVCYVGNWYVGADVTDTDGFNTKSEADYVINSLQISE